MAYVISVITGEDYDVVLARYHAHYTQAPRYNIAPSQENVVVVPAPRHGPRMAKLKWGHFRSFARESSPTFLINARSETALQKPTFKAAMNQRRCLVPADGFYEWKRDERGRAKQAYYFTKKDGGAYFMAGLSWPAQVDQPENYIILTTSPNELLKSIHDRMPVILTDETAKQWIDESLSGEQAVALCQTFPAAEMNGYPVSAAVNSAKNDGPECIVPVARCEEPPKESQGTLF
jgi:putative SOS response-associated peptidase YedK